VRRIILLLAVLLALPAFAQDSQEKKPRAKRGPVPLAHTKPTPQQIREFNMLEKEEEKEAQQNRGPHQGANQGRTPIPAGSQTNSVRAPSPK
jgi:hypothetical protein